MPVVWHRKMFAFRLAHSSAVRINYRGISFIPMSHTLHISMVYGSDSISIQDLISTEATKQRALLTQITTTASGTASFSGIQSNHSSLRLGHGHLHPLTIDDNPSVPGAVNYWRRIQCLPARYMHPQGLNHSAHIHPFLTCDNVCT